MTRFIRWALTFSFLICIVVPSLAQSRNTGEIRGTVTAAGAVVAGATVTLVNIDTGETQTFLTNGDGIYDTVSTRAGNYTISFTAKGFKRLVRGPITLQVDVITEDASLVVGAVTETITVEASGVPLLETETSHLGTVLEAKTVSQLPQVGFGITGNDWANFNILLPGASSSPTQPSSEGSGSYNAGDAVSLNGNLPNYANFLQDGGVVQLPVSNNVDNTLFEAVQEVQINTSTFSAEYGIGGAVFNQITKSGTNRFHGSAYEYFQNNYLNAAPYFEVNGVPAKPALLRYDQWGGSIGGPIIKNKLFFFFVRDKIYLNGAAPPTLGSTPTLAERGMGPLGPNLDFTATGLPTLYDPATTVCTTPAPPAAPVCTRTSFAAENTGALAGLNVIPVARLDPVAGNILTKLFPLPNTGAPGALNNNFSTILPVPEPTLRYFGRIDYDISQKNRLTFSIGQKNTLEPMKYGPFKCPLNCFSGDVDGYAVQATITSTITPTLVNELRMAYTKQGNWFIPDSVGYNNQTELGLQYAKANVFPSINIGGAGLCCSGGVAPGTNAIYIENLYDPSDTVTLIHGKHILHFGVEVLMGQPNVTPWGNVQAGNFTFTGNYTALQTASAGTTGAGLADFLLGDVQNWSANNTAIQYGRLKSPQLFVQDDFKFRPNFTINLGLRYVATTGITEKYNSLGGFDPNLTLACTVDVNGNPCGAANGSLGSMWFAPQNNRTSLQKPIYDIFLPRIGFAWSIRNDTVVRGGFGMYSYNFSDDDYGNGLGLGAPDQFSGSFSDKSGGTGLPLLSLSAPASAANPFLSYVGGTKVASQYLNVKSPSNQTYVPYYVSPGRINNWQLSVQHEFRRDYMASIAYVGSHGSNLQFGTDVNQITSATGLADIGAASALVQTDRPFQAWGSLQGYNYDGISNFNALQASITKRYSNGLLYSFNYVWSHFLDDQDSGGWGSRGGTQYWQIGNNAKINYGNSNFDIPNAYKGYVSYELPFGKGKPYLNGNTILNEAVGGFRISGTMLTQSGNPFTVVNQTNSNASYTGCAMNVGGTSTGGAVNNGCNWFPNVIASTHVGNPGPSEWFNTAAFANAWTPGSGVPFAFGNEGRNSLRGPRLTVFNMSFAKDFSITEYVKLELRSDWVNIFNHPSLNIPGQSFGGSNFGEINNATLGNGVTVGARTGQLSARVSF
ncbi:MAG TPA: carboxypeptidase-like regulatory domain-containing protein [Terriglobales bacterium]